jgi:hypothetical protein
MLFFRRLGLSPWHFCVLVAPWTIGVANASGPERRTAESAARAEVACGDTVVANGTREPRDWKTDRSKLWFPLAHAVSATRGGILDAEAFGGANIERSRIFSTAYVALSTDGAGNLLEKPKHLRVASETHAYDFRNDWSLVSPNEQGDLSPFHRTERCRWPYLGFGSAERTVERTPALLLDRQGLLQKRETFYYRYPILVVHETTSEDALRRLGGKLQLAGHPGLVFVRRFTADEREQVAHLVRVSHNEEIRVRTMALPADTNEEKERSLRARELRAFRFVEIPPVRRGPLLWTGPEAPYVPESAALERRTSIDGIGEAKRRYAYFSGWQRLVELTPARMETGSVFVVRALVDPEMASLPEPMIVPAEELPRYLPELFFAKPFQWAYLGE